MQKNNYKKGDKVKIISAVLAMDEYALNTIGQEAEIVKVGERETHGYKLKLKDGTVISRMPSEFKKINNGKWNRKKQKRHENKGKECLTPGCHHMARVKGFCVNCDIRNRNKKKEAANG